jgi:hypothetical protein
MWTLPTMALGGLRRAFVPVWLVYGLGAAVANPELVNVRNGALFGAMLFGPELLITLLAVAGYRQCRLLPYVPAYFGFRLFRSYVALEALLSFRYKPVASARVRTSVARAAALAR